MASFKPPLTTSPSLAMPTSTVELSIRCTKLADKDVMSKSDPLCVLYMKTKLGHWQEVGRTETIRDNLNPEWQKKFVLNYSFEERQEVKLEVYDHDANTIKLDAHDFLGRAHTTLGAVVSSGKEFSAPLKEGPKKSSMIHIMAEELEANKEVVTFQLAAKGLDKKDLFGKSDPFFVVAKSSSSASGRFVVVKRSEVLKKTVKPTYRPMTVSTRELCNNNEERPIRFDVNDWNSSGKESLIGSFTTDLRTLKTAAIEQRQFELINDKKRKSKGKKYKNSGVVYFTNVSVEQEISFLDYIQGGTAMNFSVAVDFTASNGHPSDPRSLHHLRPGFADNQYTTAIRSVGSIIEDYDSDKLFPALGFGARVPPTHTVSHEFFLNLHPSNPYCQGVDGLLQAYFMALQSVQLYGPTNFAPVIRHVTKFAQSYQDGKQYFVLLIITDGIITDMDSTKAAIIEASVYPMSIIIVGVGNEDFGAMEDLDSDDRLLRHNGRIAQRDIVQFVEMRKYVSQQGTWDKEFLAKDVLAEIPKQVVGWMKKRGIKPMPKSANVANNQFPSQNY